MNNYTLIRSGNHPIYLCDINSYFFEAFFKNSSKEYSKIFILTDENTNLHCLPLFLEITKIDVKPIVIQIESGEKNKTIETVIQLWKKLIDSRADRNSLLVTLGGGVICDLGGFVAATYMRGISFIHFPTTLVAMVDASIGGKVGANIRNLKNQVGLIAQPLAVFILQDFLKTLPQNQLLSGFSEMVKHALIHNKVSWEKMNKVIVNEIVDWKELINDSVKIKVKIVNADPYEHSYRKILNFGHTIGHAFETLAMKNTQNQLLHGEAVAMGMLCEIWLSTKLAGLNTNEMNEINNFILSQFQYYVLPENSENEILEILSHDKKNIFGEFNFTLLSAIGKPVINQKCSVDLIRESLNYYRNLKHN